MSGPHTVSSGNERDQAAVVLHLGPSALEVSRALGRRGVQVFGLDTRLDVGAHSRYCRARLCADPRRAPAELCDSLVQLARELRQQPVLMPLGDDWVLFASDHRARLESHYRFVQPSPAVLATLTDKAETYALAPGYGIEPPAHAVVESVSDVQRAGTAVGFPCLLKPAHSPDWAQDDARAALGQAKLLVAQDSASLRTAFERARPFADRYVVQELVPGPDTNNYYVVCYIDSTGIPRARFVHRKLLMRPPGRGVGCLIESVSAEALANRAMDFLVSVGYLGLAGMEFKRDERDGRFKLLDLNPRWGIGDSLAGDCGIDMAWLYYLDCLGVPVQAAGRYRLGVKWVQMRSYLRAAWMAHRDGQVKLIHSLSNLGGELHHSVLALDDPGPAAWMLSDMLVGQLSRRSRRAAGGGPTAPQSVRQTGERARERANRR